MFKSSKILTILAVSSLPLAAIAAPTVTFEGEVTDQTCVVSVNGQTNSVVMLPTVAMTEFGATLTNGQSAGQTPFTVSISGCKVDATNAQPVKVKFLGYDVDASTGVLGNRATTNEAAGFGIQLMDEGTGGNPIVLNGPTSVSGLSLAANATSASHDFGARYFVTNAAIAKPGKITAVAEYTLSYF
ncbi:TPA: type 1 fimbrial protein [Serratia odorifera]|nr:type 1 fimbrial protein [Serratia odorifera]